MKQNRKRWLGGILALMMTICLCCIPAVAAGSTVADAAEGVVRVYTIGADGSGYVGSAFGIGRVGKQTDTFITNRHVVTTQNDDGSFTVARRVYLVPEDGLLTYTEEEWSDYYDGYTYYTEDWDTRTDRMVECEVLYYDEEYDFAVIRALSSVDRIALELADSAESAKPGDPVWALGYPAADDLVSTSTEEFTGNYYNGDINMPIYRYTYSYNGSVRSVTTTSGNISRYDTIARENNVRVLKHDATISGGNSGGPLINADGQVLGINTFSGSSNETQNYAVYIDYVRDYLDGAGISYNTHGGGAVLAVILILVVVVVVVVVVILVATRRKEKASAPVSDNPDFADFAGPSFAPSADAADANPTAPPSGGGKNRYCPYCGAPVKEGVKFCGTCGKKL